MSGGPWSLVRAWRWGVVPVYVLSVVIVTVQQGVVHRENNFAIFRASFYNLMAGHDLYALHPDQHTDLFKYSPTFALLFAPFALPSFALGLLAWNALNTLLLLYAIRRVLSPHRAAIAAMIVALEAVGSMQHSQSNGLVAAVIVLAFVASEAGSPLGQAVAIATGTCVKIFPIAAASAALTRPRRLRFALYIMVALAVMVLLPLLVTSPLRLADQYASWRALQIADASALEAGWDDAGGGLYGGVMQQLRIWLGVQWPNWPVQVAGTALLVLPLAVRRDCWPAWSFRFTYLCSLLVYVVIFNHQSESPSFVIAVTGIALWYATGPSTRPRTALIVATILLVSLWSTDLTPRWLYALCAHYRVKTLPCLAAWLLMQRDLLVGPRRGADDRAEMDEGDIGATQPVAHAIGE
ncbi:MAG: glycosyltransferase family 87 protein [Gemmatimonadaceae bacterium]